MSLTGQARQSGKPTEWLSKDRHKEAEMHAAVSWTIWGCGQVKASLRILREFSGAWELGENVTIWLEGLFHMSLLRIVQLREKSQATLTSQAASHFASHFWHKYYSPYEWGNWGLMRLHNLSGVSLREVTVQGHCPRHDTSEWAETEFKTEWGVWGNRHPKDSDMVRKSEYCNVPGKYVQLLCVTVTQYLITSSTAVTQVFTLRTPQVTKRD